MEKRKKIKDDEQYIKVANEKLAELEEEKNELIERYTIENDETQIKKIETLMEQSKEKYFRLYLILQDLNNEMKNLLSE